MNAITIDAQLRESGKKAAKEARRADLVPGVIYGYGVEPVTVAVPRLSLRPLIYTRDFHTVKLVAGDQSWDCMVKEVDYHPVSDEPIHIDFQVLVPGRPVTATVPVHFDGTPVGQIAGGRTRKILRTMTIIALPEFLPASINVDITDLAIGDTIHVSDLDLEGIEFTELPQQTIVAVGVPRGGMLPEDEEGDEDDTEMEEGEGEGEEGEEATAEAEA